MIVMRRETFALLLVVGLCLCCFGVNGTERGIGGLLIAVGATVLTQEAIQRRHIRQAAEAARQREHERERKRESRRERDIKTRQERQTAKEVRVRAETRRREVETSQQEHVEQEREQTRRERQARTVFVEREARRIANQPKAEWHVEVETAFRRRGFAVTRSDADDGVFDLILTRRDNSALEIARCLPPDNVAQVLDWRELDEARRHAGAEHAYLVALAGFAPELVRLAPTVPLTLVESHLLAVWQAIPSSENEQTASLQNALA